MICWKLNLRNVNHRMLLKTRFDHKNQHRMFCAGPRVWKSTGIEPATMR